MKSGYEVTGVKDGWTQIIARGDFALKTVNGKTSIELHMPTLLKTLTKARQRKKKWLPKNTNMIVRLKTIKK